MASHRTRWATAALTLALAGCSASPFADHLAVDRRPLAASLETFTPRGQSDVPSASPVALPTGAVSLSDSLSAALMHSPQLAAYAYDVRAAEARAVQASRGENPELAFDVEEFGGTRSKSGTDALEATLALSQLIPLGGDIKARQALAAREGQAAAWVYETARINVVTQVTRRFVAVVIAQEQAKLAAESINLAQQALDAAQRRVEAGDAPDLDRTRAALPVVTAKIELRHAQRQLADARAALSLTWGQARPAFDHAVGDLHSLRAIPTLDQIVSRLNQSPALAERSAEIAIRRAALDLTRAEAVPDLTGTAGLSYFNESDDVGLVLGISLPLAIADRRRGDLRSARLEVASAMQRHRLMERALEADLAQAYRQLADAQADVTALENDALGPAVALRDALQDAFESGNVRLTDVILMNETIVDLQGRHLEALAAFHTAAADIEGLIGESLESVRAGAQPPVEAVAPMTKDPTDE